MSLHPGTSIGPYEIVSALGAGGMGEVYRARDARLHRDVAIKVLPASFASDPDRRARFEREAQAIAALSHPNILAIYDTGVHDGQMFVVTELLEGETLGDRLRAGAMPLRKTLDAAIQIARGLAAAHDKHVVHRDLKPENVFLVRDGRVKILDFGLARQMPSAAGASETVPAATDPGVVMGTVGYMAPEQVRGGTVDARADLFAFGAVLYEMLAGRRAFQRATAAETMTAILREDPQELLQQRVDVAPALDRIVRHCLEKDPSERFQSAHDVAFALEALSGSAPAAGAPGGARAIEGAAGRRAGAIVGAAIAVSAVIAAVLAWLWWRPAGTGADADAASITIGTVTQVTADDGLEIDPAISPDGKLLAYAAGTAMRMRIYIRPVAGGRTIALSEGSTALENQPRWSPDSSRILYLTPEGAFVASALGGISQRIAATGLNGAAWAPDGKRILLVRQDQLVVATIDGAAERSLGSAKDLHSCVWSPNDKWIACAVGNVSSVFPGGAFGNIAPSGIVLLPVSGGLPVDVTDRVTLNLSPVWSPDGRQLYFVSNRQGPRDIYVVDISDAGKVVGQPRRVSTGLNVHSIAFSGAGDRLAYVTYSARANIWTLPIPPKGVVDTAGAQPVTTGNQIIELMTVSHDGRWILYDSNLHLNAEIFRIPVGGGVVERLTNDPADDFCPDLSWDGRELAYHSWRSGSRDLYVRRIDDGTPLAITSTAFQESYPTWSPRGDALAFVDQTIENGLNRGLFLISRDSSGKWGSAVSLRRGLSDRPGIGYTKPAWSEDGRLLLYARMGSVELLDVESRTTRVVFAPSGPQDPVVERAAFSEDGRTIYFKSHDAEQRALLWSVPIDRGRPSLLVRFDDLSRPSIRPDFDAHGGRFYFTLEERRADIWMAEVARARRE